MKISHETPLQLLNESLSFNDYQYILPTFYNRHKKYKDFMLNYRKQKNSFIILDNGLFEGDNLTNAELLVLIYEIKPNIFIVPDEWNDKNKTLVNAKSWFLNFKSKLPKETQLMAVLQGNTIGELIECYQTLIDIGYKHIAFNHSSEAYFDQFPNKSKLLAQSEGRKYLIDTLIKNKVINNKYYHHLLGASTWYEFGLYNEDKYKFIESCDTSAPIINGALKVLFDDKPYEKPKQKLEVFMEMSFNNEQIQYIKENIEIFRELCQNF